MPESVTISSGGYAADIGLRGGQLRRLTSLGRDIIVPADRAAGAFAGSVLAPWPNRIAAATYTHQCREFTVPMNEERTGAALHGLLFDLPLTASTHSESAAQLSGRIEPSDGYPFPLEVTLDYSVSAEDGLICSLRTTYVPDSSRGMPLMSAPYGAGFHPYLTVGEPLDECRLRLPASTMAVTEPDGTVASLEPVTGHFDLTDGPKLVGSQIDHAYTDLPNDGWTAELTHEPTELTVRLSADTPWAQVYTAERILRAGVAVEPQTCPPNAFNSGTDLVYLQPGETHRTGYSIAAIRGAA